MRRKHGKQRRDYGQINLPRNDIMVESKRSKDKVVSLLKGKTKGLQKDKREILKFVPKLRKIKKGSK